MALRGTCFHSRQMTKVTQFR